MELIDAHLNLVSVIKDAFKINKLIDKINLKIDDIKKLGQQMNKDMDDCYNRKINKIKTNTSISKYLEDNRMSKLRMTYENAKNRLDRQIMDEIRYETDKLYAHTNSILILLAKIYPTGIITIQKKGNVLNYNELDTLVIQYLEKQKIAYTDHNKKYNIIDEFIFDYKCSQSVWKLFETEIYQKQINDLSLIECYGSETDLENARRQLLEFAEHIDKNIKHSEFNNTENAIEKLNKIKEMLTATQTSGEKLPLSKRVLTSIKKTLQKIINLSKEGESDGGIINVYEFKYVLDMELALSKYGKLDFIY